MCLCTGIGGYMSNSTVYINGQPRGNSTYVIRKDRLIKAKERMEQRENKGSDEEYIENLVKEFKDYI
jgi:hypothetical protein